MASEEENTNTTTAPIPAPAQAPVPLPLYPEMIIMAIEELNDENGSNKSAISKQIESTYGNLPPAHSTLLTHHLNKMKQMGQLMMVKNNYKKPDPNALPRRGRGRPPKPKPALPAGYIPPPPRPRGRPPKSPGALSPAVKTTATTSTAAPGSVSGRKRGRPPKLNKTTSVPPAGASTASPGERRGRGRPPKVKPAMASPVGA